ncbi:hypothetical protein GQ568_02835, partial [Patescibacteria group bacterium]|nr:hypothetical protein [Patescibacteria group bacterium]
MKKGIISKTGVLSLFFLSLFFVANVGEVSATASGKVSPCDSYGDVNLDGYITTEDSSLVASNITGEVFFGIYETILADVNNDGSVNIGDLSAIDSFIAGNITTFPVCSQRSVYLYSPNGGEKFFNGDVMDIKWTASGVEQIKIYLIKGDSTENLPGISIATSVNSVSFKWTIPQSIEAGNDYKIKIIDALTEYTVNSESNHDLSDNYFSIIATPQGCADLNSDGEVDSIDLGVVGSAFNTCSGDTSYNAKFDLNGDNCINQADLDIIQTNYGKTTTCAQASSCPDINSDEVINYVDLARISSAFNTCSGDTGYDADVDLNGDGCINNAELIIIEKYYNISPSTIDSCKKSIKIIS